MRKHEPIFMFNNIKLCFSLFKSKNFYVHCYLCYTHYVTCKEQKDAKFKVTFII